MKIPEDFVLCLTASVDPMGMPGVSRPDPNVREADYAKCLQFYAEEFPQVRRILFIENTGWALDRLRGVSEAHNPHGKRFEFVSLRCNDFPRELGKSYGEFLLLDKGLEQSPMARGASYIAKLTGRNYLTNLTDIVERVKRPFGLLCDLRDHPIYDLLRIKACGHHSDTRFLVFTPDFYERNIRGTYVKCNEAAGYFAENLIYDVAKDPALAGEVIRRFPIEPDFRGLAGHWNKDYGSRRERLKRAMRGTTRRVAPWLHI
jgi:hypothetical protein